MPEVNVNWAAVVGAAVACFVLGALWFTLLFREAWLRSLGYDPQAMKKAPMTNMNRILSLTFIIEWMMAICLAFFLGNKTDALHGAIYGFLTGLPWIAGVIAINSLNEKRSLNYVLITGGYWTAGFTVMGLIIGWGQYAG